MSEAATNWQWLDTPAISFAGTTFEEVTDAVRCSQAVGLVTVFDAVEDLAVINLLAPRGTVFWGCPLRDDLIGDYSCSRTVWRDLNVEALKRELRGNRIALGGREMGWFNALVPVLRRKEGAYRAYRSLSEGRGYPEYGRHWSLALRADEVSSLKSGLECQAREFGPLAFFRCEEALSLQAPVPDRALGDARFYGLGHDISGLAPDIGGRPGLLESLERTVRSLEKGEPFDFDCSPKTVVGGTFELSVEALTPRPESTHPDFGLERRIHSLRARMVRLLGWPSYFAHASNVLSADNMYDVRSFGVCEPYDLVEELTAYLSEAQHRFPVLRGKAGASGAGHA